MKDIHSLIDQDAQKFVDHQSKCIRTIHVLYLMCMCVRRSAHTF